MQDDYFPSAEEYDPHISAETWLALLKNSAVVSPGALDLLNKILELGGESSCAHLAEVYGGNSSSYNNLGWHLGESVKKALQLPDPADKAFRRFYVIPFVGKYIQENGQKRYIWKLRKELREALMTLNDRKQTVQKDNTDMAINAREQTMQEENTDIALNTILYGPPGTGKTYATVLYAVAVLEKKKLADMENEKPADVFQRYAKYREQGRVAFTTFHQSYGYEEFIEGIKPAVFTDDEEESSDIRYRVEPGVFKLFCEKAERPKAPFDNGHFGIGDSPYIWKVSLEGTGDNPTRTECMENGHIRIGWDVYGPDISDETDFSSHGGKAPLNAFIHRMNIGDIVLSCYSASTIDAVGIVTGEYEWHDEYPEYKRLRRVNWIVKGLNENIVALNGGKTLTLSSVYRLGNMALSDVYALINAHLPVSHGSTAQQRENHVFIIDEINRGNISKIFGELITLLEETKRLNRPEETKALLPYSQKAFGIPDNVYIIGTMNTADRSIALLDTALRRRFQFREMMPRPDLLSGITVEGLSVSTLLETMNRRIAVLYDREHAIGHACFMSLRKKPTLSALSVIFRNSILPLLQEYFYDDYEKIRLVLGDNQKNGEPEFIVKTESNIQELFGHSLDNDIEVNCEYRINESAFNSLAAYRFLQ